MGTFITVLVPGLRMGGSGASAPAGNPPVSITDVYRPQQSVGGTSKTTQPVGGKTGGGS